jgi:putative PIN family toxin of toxin-antitoxin system
MKPKVVVDTNVVVAGLMTSESVSPVARTLDGMLSAAFVFAVSQALLTEYREVLVRPSLRWRHGLSVAEVESLLAEIALHAIILQPEPGPRAPDPGDQLLWDLLGSRGDLVLVTGDQALLDDAGMRGRVILPRDFIDR